MGPDGMQPGAPSSALPLGGRSEDDMRQEIREFDAEAARYRALPVQQYVGLTLLEAQHLAGNEDRNLRDCTAAFQTLAYVPSRVTVWLRNGLVIRAEHG